VGEAGERNELSSCGRLEETAVKRIFLSLLLVGSTTSANADVPFLGRCHMNYCGWIKISEGKLLKQQGEARLYEVKSSYGQTFHKDGNYPERFSKGLKVEWGGEDVAYIFCYNKLPVYYGEEAVVLDFTMIAGAVESAANEYVRVCYGAEPYSWDQKAFLKKHDIGVPFVDEIKVKEPMDLFKYVK
jgi:hypothetical protein